MTKHNAVYSITVYPRENTSDFKLSLQFVDIKTMEDAYHELRRDGHAVEKDYNGTKVYSSAKEAIECVKFWRQ